MNYKFAVTNTSHPAKSAEEVSENSKEHKTFINFYSYEKAIEFFIHEVSVLDTGCVQMWDLDDGREMGKFYN